LHSVQALRSRYRLKGSRLFGPARKKRLRLIESIHSFFHTLPASRLETFDGSQPVLREALTSGENVLGRM